MTLVAIITVRTGAKEKFRAFETHAAAVMRTHGGRIERTIVMAPDDSPDVFKEIHVVTFPNAQAFAAYRNDERLGQVAYLREESVVNTEIFIGEDAPTYGAS
jgi:antibiotic biosynthesis monooxygenase (ABM) superfamily enzyme